ncbi:MAG: hypothetical protein ACP5UV_02100 [Thermoplasmata archaeon]
MIVPSNRSDESNSRLSFLHVFHVKNRDKTMYSQGRGLSIMFIFSLLLWWFPIFGAAIAGYIGGRRSGNVRRSLVSALVVSAIFILLGSSMMPFRIGIIKSIGNYLLYGIVPLSSSSLVSASNVMTYFYSSYGIIYAFTILVPSSAIILLIFSAIGGYVSNMKESEKKFYRNEDEKEIIDVPEKVDSDLDEDESKYNYL